MPKELVTSTTVTATTPKKKGGKADNQTNALKDISSISTTDVLSEMYLFVKRETFKAYRNGVVIFVNGTDISDVVEATDTFETFVEIKVENRPKYGIDATIELKYADILLLKHKGMCFGTRTGQPGYWLLTCNGTKHKVARIDGAPVALADMIAAEPDEQTETEQAE